jgi:hypothetical protein
LARFIPPTARQARRCVVLANRASCPSCSAASMGSRCARGASTTPRPWPRPTLRHYETVAFHTVKTAEDMKRSFVPLRGDPERVGALRQRYSANARGPLLASHGPAKTPTRCCPISMIGRRYLLGHRRPSLRCNMVTSSGMLSACRNSPVGAWRVCFLLRDWNAAEHSSHHSLGGTLAGDDPVGELFARFRYFLDKSRR